MSSRYSTASRVSGEPASQQNSLEVPNNMERSASVTSQDNHMLRQAGSYSQLKKLKKPLMSLQKSSTNELRQLSPATDSESDSRVTSPLATNSNKPRFSLEPEVIIRSSTVSSRNSQFSITGNTNSNRDSPASYIRTDSGESTRKLSNSVSLVEEADVKKKILFDGEEGEIRQADELVTNLEDRVIDQNRRGTLVGHQIEDENAELFESLRNGHAQNDTESRLGVQADVRSESGISNVGNMVLGVRRPSPNPLSNMNIFAQAKRYQKQRSYEPSQAKIKELQDQLNEIRTATVKLQKEFGRMTVAGSLQILGSSNASMTTSADFTHEKRDENGRTPLASSASRKDDSFFSSIMKSDKNKMDLEVVRKRNQMLQQQMRQQQLDFKQFQDAHSSSLSSLLNKIDTMKDNFTQLESIPASGSRAGSEYGDRNYQDDASSEVVSNYSPRDRLDTKGSKNVPANISAKTKDDQIPIPEISTRMKEQRITREEGDARVALLLEEFQKRLDNQKEELCKTIITVHQQQFGSEKGTTIAATLSEFTERMRADQAELVKKLSVTAEGVEDILRKMNTVEKTQALLAENVWRH